MPRVKAEPGVRYTRNGGRPPTTIEYRDANGRTSKYVPTRDAPTAAEPKPEAKPRVVAEPDMYRPGRRSFLIDLKLSADGNEAATERLQQHQQHELRRLPEAQKRAMTSSTLGGIVTPQYLVDVYAKASRNGRVYADQVNKLPLPENGVSIVVPRLTQGLAAGIQASENTAAATQDVTETDLSVPVRTIAGYVPVSFQGLERQPLAESALFEDMVARYNVILDQQCISGSGSAGQLLGVLNTSGIATSTAGTADAKTVLSKIEDCAQQIENSLLGVAGTVDKLVMHPRRFRWLCALSDVTNNRPIVLIEASEPEASEASSGYVGRLAHMSIYIDANIPTNLGASTSEDRIIVMSSRLVNLWENPLGPMTVRIDQQAGTSLQSQLVIEGYAAFAAGRYPLASGVVSGAGLVSPSFP